MSSFVLGVGLFVARDWRSFLAVGFAVDRHPGIGFCTEVEPVPLELSKRAAHTFGAASKNELDSMTMNFQLILFD